MTALHVFIVDDDIDLRRGLSELFSNEGFEVGTAANGAEAIEWFEVGGEPCVVLVDLLMPGIVGHELLDYLRSDEALASIPIAIISGSPERAPTGYTVFTKPLDTHALREFVRARVATCRS
jgi:CheY-like chemotaxis protein